MMKKFLTILSFVVFAVSCSNHDDDFLANVKGKYIVMETTSTEEVSSIDENQDNSSEIESEVIGHFNDNGKIFTMTNKDFSFISADSANKGTYAITEGDATVSIILTLIGSKVVSFVTSNSEAFYKDEDGNDVYSIDFSDQLGVSIVLKDNE